MKILTIGTDKNVFKDDSEVRQRMIEYGRLAEQLHIIVFSTGKFSFSQISENTFLYPTNSFSRWCYVFDAFRIAKKIFSTSYKLQATSYLITCQDPFEAGLAGWLVARKFKFPLQLQIHTDFLNSYFWQESFLNKIRVLLAKFLIPRATCVRVVSKRIKNSLLQATSYPERFRFGGINGAGKSQAKVLVLPIFVDIDEIKNAPVKTDLRQKYPQFDFFILMASRLTAEKNIGLAVEAMTEVIKEYPKTGLIIIGDGPERESLELRIMNYELGNNIKMENWTVDLVSYYKTADLFLLTSNYEGYGRTIIEAVVSGCMVISSNVGIADEILDKENIFEPDNKEQLKQKIIKAIEDRSAFAPSAFKLPIKEEYLRAYKKSWENCGG